MLGNYSGPWLGKKKAMAVQRTKRATMQTAETDREYNHITTMEWSYYDIMMERLKCAVAEFR